MNIDDAKYELLNEIPKGGDYSRDDLFQMLVRMSRYMLEMRYRDGECESVVLDAFESRLGEIENKYNGTEEEEPEEWGT